MTLFTVLSTGESTGLSTTHGGRQRHIRSVGEEPHSARYSRDVTSPAECRGFRIVGRQARGPARAVKRGVGNHIDSVNCSWSTWRRIETRCAGNQSSVSRETTSERLASSGVTRARTTPLGGSWGKAGARYPPRYPQGYPHAYPPAYHLASGAETCVGACVTCRSELVGPVPELVRRQPPPQRNPLASSCSMQTDPAVSARGTSHPSVGARLYRSHE